jgi:ubiquitin carboxyl-terminal hydrolase L3
MQASNDDNWKPLESNPEVMNTYATKIGSAYPSNPSLGLNTEKYTFQDLLGFEDWAYEMIPQPVIGVVFNFPCKPVQAEFAKAQEQSIIQDGY